MAQKKWNVGIVGATGMVGQELFKVLSERDFPLSGLRAFTSPRSAGERIPFAEDEVLCEELSRDSLEGLDLILSSAGGAVSSEWASRWVGSGAVTIDNTSWWRMHERVPLVVAGVNDEALLDHQGLVANPNCTTMQLMMALAPIEREVGLERVVVSTYQSVSGNGRLAVEELHEQARAVLDGDPVVTKTYPHQVAFNVIPQVEDFADESGYTTEELKVMNESKKILGRPDLPLTATCVRVPVFTGHSESVNIETREKISPAELRELLAATDGIRLLDDPAESRYPMPITAAGRDEVLVGRIRQDPSRERCINLWVVGDNLRKGAATNAVQLAEALVERGLVRAGDPELFSA